MSEFDKEATVLEMFNKLIEMGENLVKSIKRFERSHSQLSSDYSDTVVKEIFGKQTGTNDE